MSETVVGSHGTGHIAEGQLEPARSGQVLSFHRARIPEGMVHCNTHRAYSQSVDKRFGCLYICAQFAVLMAGERTVTCAPTVR
jgi:hypothetical protein